MKVVLTLCNILIERKKTLCNTLINFVKKRATIFLVKKVMESL